MAEKVTANFTEADQQSKTRSKTPKSASSDTVTSQDYYEDEFDEYEQDFEEFDEAADYLPPAVYNTQPVSIKAHDTIEIKNIDISKSLARYQPQEPQPTRKIDTRFKTLSSLITLNYTTIAIFSLEPQSPYELYLRTYGRHQVNESCQSAGGVDDEAQTSDWNVADVWTQAPPVQFLESKWEAPGFPWLKQKVKSKKLKGLQLAIPEDQARMRKVIKRSGIVMDLLLTQMAPDREKEFDNGELIKNGVLLMKTESNIKFIKALANDMYAIVTSTLETPAKSMVNIYQNQNAIRTLLCYSEITTLFASLNSPLLVLGGCSDGSMQAWDLRIPGSEQWPLTTAVGTDKIIGIEQVSGTKSASFQISTICADGIQDWVIALLTKVVITKVDDDDANEKVKLVIGCSDPAPDEIIVAARIPKSSRYLAMDASGVINHCSFRKSEKCFPRKFRISQGVIDVMWSLEAHPSLGHFLAASHKNVILFDLNREYSIYTWEFDEDIIQLKWSPHRPGVFFVLVGESKIHIYDLNCEVHKAIDIITVEECISFEIVGEFLVTAYEDGRIVVSDLDSSLIEPLEAEKENVKVTILNLLL